MIKKLFNNSNLQKGFTLIELMVVISIISFLSSVVTAAAVDIKQKALITSIQRDYVAIRDAIQAYRLDNNGQFPTTQGDHTGYLVTISELVNQGYLQSAPNVDNVQNVLKSRVTDPRISYNASEYCEGTGAPTDYYLYFRYNVSQTPYYDGVFPRLLQTATNQHVLNSYYCFFLPIQ